MHPNEILQQSKAAYGQWCKQWRAQAKVHSKYEMKPLSDFLHHGVGKACLLVANGFSLEENMDTIIKYRDNVDIIACDKSIGVLIDHGIQPDFCMVCDANVSYEKYLEPWKDKLENTTLFINVCGNPEWTEKGNWKDRYFFVNMDVIKSELEFGKISGCQNQIPAATNVSNAMLVFLTQCTNEKRINFFGYDKLLLIGYDYSWRPNSGYYAYDHKGGDGKHHYMRHQYLLDCGGTFCYTSNNLLFSARWLNLYVRNFGLNVVNCSSHTLLSHPPVRDLKEQMQYQYRLSDKKTVQKLTMDLQRLSAELHTCQNRLMQIGVDHQKAYLRSI